MIITTQVELQEDTNKQILTLHWRSFSSFFFCSSMASKLVKWRLPPLKRPEIRSWLQACAVLFLLHLNIQSFNYL